MNTDAEPVVDGAPLLLKTWTRGGINAEGRYRPFGTELPVMPLQGRRQPCDDCSIHLVGRLELLDLFVKVLKLAGGNLPVGASGAVHIPL